MSIDILNPLWRFFGSRRLTLALLLAVLVVFSAGATIPQMPDDLDTGSPEYARWRADTQARYLQWAATLQRLGLFSIYGSIWFKAPLALLALNLVVCSVDRLEAALHWPGELSPDLVGTFPSAWPSHSLLLPGNRQAAWPRLSALMEDLGYAVRVDETGGTTYLTAHRFAAGRWATLVIHAGAVLAVTGLLLSPRLSWRERDITLAPGQEYQLRHAQSLTIRLDEYEATKADHPANSPAATVSILEDGREVSTGLVLPGVPLRHKGITVWQVRDGPLIHLRATDAEGEPLPLQALAPSGQLTNEVTVQFDEEEREGYLAVPERDLILRLMLQPTKPDQPESMDQVLVEAYRGGSTEVVSRSIISESESLEIDGDSYYTEWGRYAVLAVSRDLSVFPVALGAISLLVGSTTALFFRQRSIYARVKDNEGVTRIEVFGPGPREDGQVAPDFVKLISRLKEISGGP
ncbi:MAG TPA: hypothetical protein ENO24_01095 [Chloroflexi bacterium]|nr:hypothetical protein [Chloroflexota bacterium]